MINIDDTSSLTDDGVWIDFDGSKFKIAHWSNLKFQRTFTRLQQPYRKKIESGTIDPEVSKKLLCQAMADGIVIDWQNVTSKSGIVTYSTDLAFKLLMSNVSFREFVAEFATNIDNFRQNEIEELGKN